MLWSNQITIHLKIERGFYASTAFVIWLPMDVAVANIESRTDYASQLQAVFMTKPVRTL